MAISESVMLGWGTWNVAENFLWFCHRQGNNCYEKDQVQAALLLPLAHSSFAFSFPSRRMLANVSQLNSWGEKHSFVLSVFKM